MIMVFAWPPEPRNLDSTSNNPIMEIDVLNRIKWDPNIKDKDHCEIYYEDKVVKKLIKVLYKDIWEWDKFSMRIFDQENNEDKDIPLHRIRKILDANDNILFERNV